MKSIICTVAISMALGFGLTGTTANAAEVQPINVQSAIAEFHALRHAKAKQMFADLLKDNQHKNIANYYLGRIALASGDYNAASNYLETSVGTSPNTADELYWLSTACVLMLQRPSEAKNMGLFLCYQQNLEMALSIDPTHLPALTTLHQFNVTGPAIAGASSERAAELLKQIAALSKPDADVARLLELNHKKETVKAVTLSRSMIAAYPKHEKALLEAAKTLSNSKLYADAMNSLASVTAIPVTIDNRSTIQAAYLEMGTISWRTKSNLDQGIASLTKVVDSNLFPVNFSTNWAYLRLAQLSEMKGDVPQQKKYLALLDKTGIEKGTPLLKAMED